MTQMAHPSAPEAPFHVPSIVFPQAAVLTTGVLLAFRSLARSAPATLFPPSPAVPAIPSLRPLLLLLLLLFRCGTDGRCCELPMSKRVPCQWWRAAVHSCPGVHYGRRASGRLCRVASLYLSLSLPLSLSLSFATPPFPQLAAESAAFQRGPARTVCPKVPRQESTCL